MMRIPTFGGVLQLQIGYNIWVNYNISLTWIVRPFGDDSPQSNHDSQWGRTVRSWWNLPRTLYQTFCLNYSFAEDKNLSHGYPTSTGIPTKTCLGLVGQAWHTIVLDKLYQFTNPKSLAILGQLWRSNSHHSNDVAAYPVWYPLSISQLSLWYHYDTSMKMLVQSLFSMFKSPSKNTAVLNTICHFIYTALSVGIPSSWIMIMCHMTISVGLPRLHHSCVRTHFRWRNHVKSHFWMVQSPCVSLQSPLFAGYNYNPTCFFCN